MKGKLVAYESLPDWYKDNSLIKNGYRRADPSFLNCCKSLFYLHNESGNIFTHLIGSILFTVLLINTFLCNEYKKFDFEDKLIFGTFFFGKITCLVTSSLFHCFQCHSRRIFKLMAKLDYCGITLSITCSLISYLSYGFINSPMTRNVYISLVLVIGSFSIGVSLFDRFSDPEFQSFRAILFIVFGLFGIAPFLHFCRYFYDFDPFSEQKVFRSLLLLVTMATTYIAGALIYIAKIPERLNPGYFDFWLNSHQIFHLFVIGAGLQYFHSLSLLAEVRVNHPLPQPLNPNN